MCFQFYQTQIPAQLIDAGTVVIVIFFCLQRRSAGRERIFRTAAEIDPAFGIIVENGASVLSKSQEAVVLGA